MTPCWPKPDSRVLAMHEFGVELDRAARAERRERFLEPTDEEVEWTLARREGRDLEQDHGGHAAAVDEWYECLEWNE